MKNYIVYWRFKGKPYMELPLNICKVLANTKSEVKQIFIQSTENILIKRIIEE